MHDDHGCHGHDHEHPHTHSHTHPHDHEGECHNHAHEHTHTHPHTHAHDHGHAHEPAHAHEPGGDHRHDHDACGEGTGGADMAKTRALLEYMLGHNRDHAGELGELAHKLRHAGLGAAADVLISGVKDFDRGNEKLAQALELIKGGKA